MLKHVALYGLLGGVLIAVLRWVEYRWLIVDHSMSLYGGVIALIFAALGLWLGARRARQYEDDRVAPDSPKLLAGLAQTDVSAPPDGSDGVAARAAPNAPFPANDLGITPRELEMLALIAAGLSNKEIAARAFVSENTVKTHLSRVFDKLGAKRRTQAVQRAKQLRLIA
ncbi:MAG: response regulator transcription factor [Burkholderiales bacterium]|nr:response regulator transcription factor [Burkholderiales bacterium]